MGIVGAIGGEMLGNYSGQRFGEQVFGGPGVGSDMLGIGLGALGAAGGALLPFKTGGRVPGKRIGAPKKILAHTGEYVLPVGVRPTQAQKAAVAKRKVAAAKKKAAPKKKARSRK